MPKLAIRTDGLSKRYRLGGIDRDTMRDAVMRLGRRPVGDGQADRHIWALRDVDLEIDAGEAVGLIGPNGAGKTTLLRVLTRITEPTSGTAYVTGRVGSLLEVGTGFHPELTGRENVFLNGAILGMRRREVGAKLEEIVEFAGVERFLDTPVKRYSSGMQVRLAFAVAAHLETEILLVDEVLAVGDAEFQRRCLGKMEEIGGEGRTIIFVSHSMPMILRFCERALLLDKGCLVSDGPAERVVSAYLSGEHGSSAHREWTTAAEAPGDELVRLCSARIVGEDGQTCEAADVRYPVGVEIVFDVLGQGKPIVPTISLYNDHGVHLFNAMDTSSRWATPVRPGRYRTVAWIPARLLNEGRMLVSILIVTPTSGKSERHVMVRDVVAFSTVDPGGEGSAKGTFAQQWGGAVAPLLDWDVAVETEVRTR